MSCSFLAIAQFDMYETFFYEAHYKVTKVENNFIIENDTAISNVMS